VSIEAAGNPVKSAGVNVHFVIFDAPTPGDQLDDATDVPADIPDVRRGKSVFEVAADELFIVQTHDLQIIIVAAFKIMLRTRSGAIQIIL
jgi:hypothetical protein